MLTSQWNFLVINMFSFKTDGGGERCNRHLQLKQHKLHVDCKIADALLKKGTKQHADGWDAPSKDWAHRVLHLPHAEGGFGVTFNDVTT